MKSNLTLRLEEDLIRQAKQYAHKRDVRFTDAAEYFALIEEDKPDRDNELPPITSSLSVILKDTDIFETDYKDHLEKKYLE